MRKFENKQTSIKVGALGREKNMAYGDLVKVVTDTPPREGFTVSEMKKRLDIQSLFKELEPGKTVSMDEDCYETLKGCAENHRWGGLSLEFVEFVEYIKDLPKEG